MLRAQHAEATRRAVLAAARASFGQKGYAQTSVDEIADAARVTKGAVYHHFASKEALFRAVLAEAEIEVEARAAEVLDPAVPPIDQIVARVNAYLDAALDEELRQIVLIDAPVVVGPESEDAAAQQQGHVEMRSFIAASIGRGQIVDLDPGLLTHLIRGTVWLSGILIAHAGDPEVTRAEIGRALDVMLRGLAP
jgi:AcrR family transcriptional regulator